MGSEEAQTKQRTVQNCLNTQFLPQTICYNLPQKQGKVLCRLEKNHAHFVFVDQFKKQKIEITRPIWEFKAILAKPVITTQGMKAIALTLWHKNESYCVPLLVSRSIPAIANCWKFWMQCYKLPMFLQDGQNYYIPVSSEDFLFEMLLQHKSKATLPVSIRSYRHKLGLKVLFGNRPIVR